MRKAGQVPVEPVQVEGGEDGPLRPSVLVRYRVSKDEHGEARDPADLELAGREAAGLHRVDEVRPVCRRDGAGERLRTAEDAAARAGRSQVGVSGIAQTDVREEGRACRPAVLGDFGEARKDPEEGVGLVHRVPDVVGQDVRKLGDLLGGCFHLVLAALGGPVEDEGRGRKDGDDDDEENAPADGGKTAGGHGSTLSAD